MNAAWRCLLHARRYDSKRVVGNDLQNGLFVFGARLGHRDDLAAFLPHCEQRSRGAKALSVVDGDSVGGDVAAVIRIRAKLEPADANVARHQILSALHLGHFAATLPAVGRDTR